LDTAVFLAGVFAAGLETFTGVAVFLGVAAALGAAFFAVAMINCSLVVDWR
jgi:uncharacterized membrane protein YphA (DoxX/SURF4 family)